MFQKLLRHRFLFEELVKRDFKKNISARCWALARSILSPLLQLLVMALVFTHFFGRTTPHFVVYMFCGTLVFNFFSDANIDTYSETVRKLFLLNPVYLFIRYFRKIVIEATIPTVWFHLLMLGDVVIALRLGCWMYKKYNTKFLYYV